MSDLLGTTIDRYELVSVLGEGGFGTVFRARHVVLDQWFAPKPMTTRTAHMDFRVGGRWHHAMIGEDGSEYWGIVEYREIDPIDRYATTDYFSDAEGSRNDALPSSDWEVTFSEAGDATTVRSVIQYASPEALEQVIAMGMEPGMTTTFEKLDELLLKLSA